MRFEYLRQYAKDAVKRRPDLKTEIWDLVCLAVDMVFEGKQLENEIEGAISNIDELIETAPEPGRFPHPSNHLRYCSAFDAFLPVNWEKIPVCYLVNRYLRK